MFKRILLSGAALTVMATVAVAQTAAPGANNDANTPPAATESAPPPEGAETGVTAAPDATTTEAAATAEDDPNLFSNLKGADIIGQNDERVGRIADVVVDTEGNVRQLVLGHGGVIGIGETLRAYDVTDLPVVQDGKVRLDQLTTASVETLPKYEYPSQAETGRASANGDSATVTGAPKAAPANGATTADAPTGTSGAVNPDPSSMPIPPEGSKTTTAQTGNGLETPAADNTMWPVSQLVGAAITNADESADIDDLRFAGNRIDRVVINRGGVLGLGAEEREIAFADLSIGGEPADPTITLNTTEAGGVATDQPAAGAGQDAPVPDAPATAPAQ